MENGYGAWIVMENDGLFPKETCSCSSSKHCCNIMELIPHESGRANLAETFRNNRKDHLGGKNHAKETSKSLEVKNQMQIQQVCELTIAICSCICSYVSFIL